MAKWLNKYFSLGNNKTKSPPQPPWPEYREQSCGAGSEPRPDESPHFHLQRRASADFPHRRLRDDTSDLLRAYRAQKDRDFEDPYSGHGLSLYTLPAMCRPDCSACEDLGDTVPKGFFSPCCATSATACAAGSPHLLGSRTEPDSAAPRNMKYISPKHRLIKVVSGHGTGKKLNKDSKQLTTSVTSAMKDKRYITSCSFSSGRP